MATGNLQFTMVTFKQTVYQKVTSAIWEHTAKMTKGEVLCVNHFDVAPKALADQTTAPDTVYAAKDTSGKTHLIVRTKEKWLSDFLRSGELAKNGLLNAFNGAAQESEVVPNGYEMLVVVKA